MSIGTKLIKDALKMIGAQSIALPDDSESIDQGKDYLNRMLQMWETDQIVLATTPIATAGSELNEPADATMAIVLNLAIVLAPLFDNGKANVSQVLMMNANNSYERLRQAYQVFTIPDKIPSATLPRGEGSRRFRTQRIFWGSGNTINEDSSSTDSDVTT